MLIYLTQQYYIVDYDLAYANLAHTYWTIMEYFFLFVYGTVWDSKYDMGFATGVLMQILSQLDLTMAETAKAQRGY